MHMQSHNIVCMIMVNLRLSLPCNDNAPLPEILMQIRPFGCLDEQE